MKTIVLNRTFYVRDSETQPGKFDVWKNNGASAPDEKVGTFSTSLLASAEAARLEANARARAVGESHAADVNAILLGYLADNPEITKGLLDKAIKHAAAKKRRDDARRKAAEAAIAVDNATREIAELQSEINHLRGKVLSLQKGRKALLKQAVAAAKELGALDAR